MIELGFSPHIHSTSLSACRTICGEIDNHAFLTVNDYIGQVLADFSDDVAEPSKGIHACDLLSRPEGDRGALRDVAKEGQERGNG